MNIYRTNSEIELDTKPKLYKTIHDLTNLDWNYDTCPFCFYINKKFDFEGGYYERCNFDYYLCAPNKRHYWGMFWWKKYCTISGYHKHYECKVCKTNWIVRIKSFDNPIGEIK